MGAIPIAVESSDIHLEKDGQLSAYFDSIHHPLAQDGPRLPCLQIHGISKHSLLSKVIDVRQLDWELKAADEPFDNFDELLSYCMIPMPTPMGDQTTLEILAKAPAIISSGSIIRREKARIECVIAERIIPKKIKIGYRFPKLGSLAKGVINGSELRWQKKDDTKIGVRHIPVGKAPFLQAFLSYEGIAFHQWFIIDPSKHLNPRHAIHQVIDKDLEFLNRSILEPGSLKEPAPMFEAGVSSLLYLLGFLATNYGRIPKLQQGPDIIAVTPNGNIGVIECTLGILDENNKLAKLVQRTKLVKDGLAKTGWGHLKVQAAIFTPLPRDDVAGDLEKADKLNILVFSKENLEEMLRRVNTAPDPDKLFQEAMTELTARK